MKKLPKTISKIKNQLRKRIHKMIQIFLKIKLQVFIKYMHRNSNVKVVTTYFKN